MNQRFRIGRGAEDGPVVDQSLSQIEVVGEVAVVSQRDGAVRIACRDRLDVLQIAAAGRGVAQMPDGGAAAQLLSDRPRLEDVTHRARALQHVEALLVEGHHAGGFLTSVL